LSTQWFGVLFWVFLFNRHSRQPLRRIDMGVKVTVREGESLADALKRFRQMVWRFGPPGAGRKRPKWHKQQLEYYLKPSERRRRDQLRDDFQEYSGECGRRELVCVILRRTKRRKVHFGDAPIVRR
jgi:ribosomal protein S21